MLVVANRRLSSSISYAIHFLFLNLTCFMLENVLSNMDVLCMFFQKSSAFLVRNISVWEIYLC